MEGRGWDMSPDHEIEEGEALLGVGDDFLDPDELTYIDEKLQNVLGHFQKDFEGEFCPESLGPKFGGYGSFLPTEQRSPSVVPQFRSSHVTQNNRIKGNITHPKSLEGADGGEEQNLKVRLRVVLDNTSTKDKAAICSELGLDMSPSSSFDESPYTSPGRSPESVIMPGESPHSILKSMTLLLLPGGGVISPIGADILAVRRKNMLLLRKNQDPVIEERSDPYVTISNSPPPREFKAHNKFQHDEKKGGSENLRMSNGKDNAARPINVGIDAELQKDSEIRELSLPSQLVVSDGKSTGSEESDKGTFSELAGLSGGENGLEMHRPSNRSVGNMEDTDIKTCAVSSSGKHKSHAKSGKREKALKPNNASKASFQDSQREHEEINGILDDGGKGGLEVLKVSANKFCSSTQASVLRVNPDQQETEKITRLEEQLFGDQKKQVCSKLNSDVPVVTEDSLGLKLSKGKKKSSSSSRVGSLEKRHKGKSVKESNVATVKSIRKTHGDTHRDVLDHKNCSQGEAHQDGTKSLMSSHEEAVNSSVVRSEMPSNKESCQTIPEPVVPDAPALAPVLNGGTMEATAVTTVPLVIKENWVCCDTCNAWRVLPYWILPDSLPLKWRCSMLNWLKGMNSCKISEEDTTKALHALYAAAPPSGPSSQISEKNAEYTNSSENKKIGPRYDNVQNRLNIKSVPISPKSQRIEQIEYSVNLDNGVVNTFHGDSLHHDHKSIHPPVYRKSSGSKDKNRKLHARSDKGSKVAENCRSKSETAVNQDSFNPPKKIKKDDLKILVKHGKEKSNNIGGIATSSLDNGLSSSTPVRTAHAISEVTSTRENCDNKGSLLLPSKSLNTAGDARSNEYCNSKNLACSGEASGKDISIKKRKVKQWQLSQVNPETLSSDRLSKEEGLSGTMPAKVPRLEGKVLEANDCKNLDAVQTPDCRLTSKKQEIFGMDYDENFYASKANGLVHQPVDSHGALRAMPVSQTSAAATSSSSKVSGSLKTKPMLQEARGSPVESVSSSPQRRYSADGRKSGVENEDGNAVAFSGECAKHFVVQDSITDRAHGKKERRRTADNTNIQHNGFDKAGNFRAAASCKGTSDYRLKIPGNGIQHQREFHGGLMSMDSEDNVLQVDQNVFNHNDLNKANAPDVEKHNSNSRSNSVSQRKLAKNSLQFKDKYRNSVPSVDKDTTKASSTSDKVREHDDLEEQNGIKVLLKAEGVDRNDGHLNLAGGKNSDKCVPSAQSTQIGSIVPPYLQVEKASPILNKSDDLGLVSVDKSFHARNDEGPETHFSSVKRIKQDMSNIDTSKGVKQARKSASTGVQHSITRRDTPNNESSSSSNASAVLKEARDLKHLANRMKNEGQNLESTNLYFEAALKFLHVASLWEPVTFEISKQADASQSMKMYSETSQLCDFCAREYERIKEMAAASLAYKCVEVAHLKASFYKYPIAVKDRLELLTTLQMIPPGESPSSSASDLDNLNNQNTAAKIVAAKVVNSPQIAGNSSIASRSHPHLLRLLNYTHDLNCALEASRKAQNAIAVAEDRFGDSQGDVISSVRKVLDFSFSNVKELLQLVRLSLESIRCAKG